MLVFQWIEKKPQQQCLFISTAHKFMTQLVTKKTPSRVPSIVQSVKNMSHQAIGGEDHKIKHICLSLYLWSCPRAVGQIFGSSVTRCYFHTQQPGQGARRAQHPNGFQVVTKEQISTLYAGDLAFITTIKTAVTLFCWFCSKVEREALRALQIFTFDSFWIIEVGRIYVVLWCCCSRMC